MKVLITGAAGFIGRRLCDTLVSSGFKVVPTVRGGAASGEIAVGDIGSETDWREALATQPEVVIHLAAQVQVTNDDESNQLESYRAVNVEGAVNLAHQAVEAGVKRLVYLSSIKVNGESNSVGRPFQANDIAAPEDPYGISKHEAEEQLRQIGAQAGMEVVIIRPPLVYGPGVKANFETMLRWLARGVPLPLAAVTSNRRSLVALDNLVDLIATCVQHPAAANETFLVSDGEDLSTAELLRRAGVALGIHTRLFYVPTTILKLGARMVSKQGLYQRLCGSLQVDIAKTRNLLNWYPKVSIDEGLRRALTRNMK